jgi:hypothetical protein
VISDKPWNGSPSNYTSAEAYCKACLIDENPSGQRKVKGNCSLPVYDPSGALNRNAVHAAAAALVGARGGVQAKPSSKRAAARKLISLYRQLKEQAPDALRRLAG